MGRCKRQPFWPTIGVSMVKLSEVRPADTLDYFCNRLKVPGLQLVLTENVFRQTGQVLVVSANRWLGHLP